MFSKGAKKLIQKTGLPTGGLWTRSFSSRRSPFCLQGTTSIRVGLFFRAAPATLPLCALVPSYYPVPSPTRFSQRFKMQARLLLSCFPLRVEFGVSSLSSLFTLCCHGLKCKHVCCCHVRSFFVFFCAAGGDGGLREEFDVIDLCRYCESSRRV